MMAEASRVEKLKVWRIVQQSYIKTVIRVHFSQFVSIRVVLPGPKFLGPIVSSAAGSHFFKK